MFFSSRGKKGGILSPLAPDPFEYFSAVQKEKTWWQRVCTGLLLSHALLVLALIASALRPPQVIVKDRISGAAPYLHRTGDAPQITAQDARVFFMQMIQLRYGWDSRSLPRDLKNYLGQCLQPQRAREMQFFESQVASSTGKKTTRLKQLVAQEIQNKIVFAPDVEQIECIAKENIWHCFARIEVYESALNPASPQARPPTHAPRIINASLLQVRHTVATPSGLIVGLMKDFTETKKVES